MLGLHIILIILNKDDQKSKPHHYNNEYRKILPSYQTNVNNLKHHYPNIYYRNMF